MPLVHKLNQIKISPKTVFLLGQIYLCFAWLNLAGFAQGINTRFDSDNLSRGKTGLNTNYKPVSNAKATSTRLTIIESTKLACDHLKQAESLAGKGNINAAVIEYQKSIKYKPSAFAYYGLAQLYLKQNKFNLAQSSLNQALTLSPNSFNVLSKLGELELKNRQFNSAHSHLCKALRINPHDTKTSQNLIKLWQLEIATDPKNPDNYLGLAKTYQLTGNLTKAQENFRYVVQIDPNNPDLPQARESFKNAVLKYKAKKDLILAHNLAKQGLYSEACNEACEAANLCPDDTGVKIYQASLFEQAKRYNEAYKIYLDTLKMDPNNAYALARVKALNSQISDSARIISNNNPTAIIAKAGSYGNYQNLNDANYVNSNFGTTQCHINSLSQFFGALRNEGIARQLNFQDYEAKVHKSLTGRNSYYTATGQLGDLPVMPGTVKPQIPLPDLELDNNSSTSTDSVPNSGNQTPVLDGGVSQSSYVGQALAELDYPQSSKLSNLTNVVGNKIPNMLNPTNEGGREKIKNLITAAGDIVLSKSDGNPEDKYIQALSDLTKTKKINENGQIVESPNKFVQAISDLTQKQTSGSGNKYLNAFKDLTDNSKPINSENPENNMISSVNHPIYGNSAYIPNNYTNNNQISNLNLNNLSQETKNQLIGVLQNNPGLIQNNPNLVNQQTINALLANNSTENQLALKGPISKNPESNFTSSVKASQLNNRIADSDIISFNQTNAKSYQFILEGIHKTKTGVNLSVVFKNPTSSELNIPKNTLALIRIPNQEPKHVKVAFLDNIVPAHGEIHGVIKLPFSYCKPNADMYLEKVALINGGKYQNIHLDLPTQAISSMIAAKKTPLSN